MKLRTAAKIAVLGAGAYALYRGAGELATRLLVANALDREEPYIMQKVKNIIKGSSKGEEIQKKIDDGIKKLTETPTRRVTIRSYDGLELVGHYYPAENPERLIVAMHGWRSSWKKEFCALADFWYENGCSVLYAEQRGQGESGGKYMGFGTQEYYDCRDWACWLNLETGGSLPMYLAGISMGGTSVLMCEGIEMPENVRGIIADCGFTSAKAIWKHVCEDNLHISYSKREDRANMLCRCRIGCDADYNSTLNVLKNAKIPVLFIHGTADTFVPVEMTYQNYLVCKAPKRLLIVPGAGHGLSALIDPDAYQRALISFWKDFDIH